MERLQLQLAAQQSAARLRRLFKERVKHGFNQAELPEPEAGQTLPHAPFLATFFKKSVFIVVLGAEPRPVRPGEGPLPLNTAQSCH